MTSIINVLSESFQLLVERPVFFVPKLVSALLGAFWFVGFFEGYGPLYLYAATFPVVALAGGVAAVMVAGMVKYRGSEKTVVKGFREALDHWKSILAMEIVLFISSMLIVVPVILGVLYIYFTGSYLVLALGVLASSILLLAVTFLVYFFPISLIEKGSALKGVKDSARTSLDNSSEVFMLTLFSFALLVTASAAGDRNLRFMGYAGFVAARALSAIISTYVFVVSPKYYLD